MPSTIEQTKGAILKHGGRASKHQISRELKISLDYAGLILGELKRKGEVAFLGGFYTLTSIHRPGKLKGIKKAKRSRGKEGMSHPLASILGINASLARTLEKAGYNTVESLADAPIKKLMDAAELKLHTAAQLINQARKTK